MDAVDKSPTWTFRRIWQVVHVIATFVLPWAFSIYFYIPAGELRSFDDEYRAIFSYHEGVAIAAGVLLLSTLALRRSGPRACATYGFATAWALALVSAVAISLDYRYAPRCTADLCLVGFETFVLAAPFTIIVSIAAIVSVAIHRSLAIMGRGQQPTA